MREVFSIIMPAYNAESTIHQSICSVLEQSYEHFALYIIDDCSVDKTHDIINSFFDNRIKLIVNPTNLGVSVSRNKGIEMAQGSFLAFLDSDDIWHPTKLEKQFEKLTSGFDIVCSNYIAFSDGDDFKHGQVRVSPENISYPDMLKSNYIGNLTGVYNAKKLGKHYQCDVGHEDYVMWLGIMKEAKNAFCLQENLAYYRLSSGSLSANKLRAMKWQWGIYRQQLKLPVFLSSYFFIHYLINAYKKRNS